MEPSPLDRLPHRAPFRFLSSVDELIPGTSGSAIWRVTGDEPFFLGHFPGDPVVPGVLIAEALAQISGLVGLHGDVAGARSGRLAQIDLRFDSAVIPPAEVRLTARLVRKLGALRQFQVEASAGGQVAVRGSLVLAALGADGQETGA